MKKAFTPCALLIATIFLLTSCLSSALVSMALAGLPAVRQGAPDTFTGRTDTAEWANLIMLASGIILIPIPEGIVERVAAENCTLYGGLKGFSAGTIATNPRKPLLELNYVCFYDRTYSRRDLNQLGANMKPKRVVLRYDLETRTVTFGLPMVGTEI